MRNFFGVTRLVRRHPFTSLIAAAGLAIGSAAVASCNADTDAKAGPNDPPVSDKPKNVLFNGAKWDDIPVLASGDAWKAYGDQSLRLEVGDHLGFAIVIDTMDRSKDPGTAALSWHDTTVFEVPHLVKSGEDYLEYAGRSFKRLVRSGETYVAAPGDGHIVLERDTKSADTWMARTFPGSLDAVAYAPACGDMNVLVPVRYIAPCGDETITYAKVGRACLPTSRTDRYGHTTKAIVSEGHVIVSDLDGASTSYVFDSAGHLIEVTGPESPAGALVARITWGGVSGDRPTSLRLDTPGVTEGPFATLFDFTTAGDVERVRASTGETSLFGHRDDAVAMLRGNTKLATRARVVGGQVVERVLPSQAIVRYEYNSTGRLAAEVPEGNAALATRYEHDTAGALTGITIPGGATAAYTLDPKTGLVTEERDYEGRVTRYTLNASGARTSVRYASGATTTYVLDAKNNPLTVTESGTPSPVTVEYDEHCSVLKHTGADGIVTSAKYDERGRAVSETVAGKTVSLSYERTAADGFVQRSSDSTASSTVRQDAYGRPLSQSLSLNGAAEWTSATTFGPLGPTGETLTKGSQKIVEVKNTRNASGVAQVNINGANMVQQQRVDTPEQPMEADLWGAP